MLDNLKCHDENKAEELLGDYFRLRGQWMLLKERPFMLRLKYLPNIREWHNP